ncbi:MAG TPA: V-type ATPase subunit [Gemmatimonadales bacterium]|nr:V-type ATPase subunit [Gemmatimonadales bacterium]
MSPRWDDVNARARGLSTHLLEHAQLAALSAVPDLPTLAARLRDLGLTIPETAEPTAAELELAVRRRAARELAILGRWTARRPELVAVLFDEEDRRSVRALVRGAVERAPAELRIAGLVPTPALPERALEELARAPTPAAVAALLVAWQHPYGPPLAARARSPQPDLYALEQALDRAAAARLTAVARRVGGLLAAFVHQTIDLENALGAVALASVPTEVAARDAFLAGGRSLLLEAFERAVATRDPAAAADRLAKAFDGDPMAAVLRQHRDDVAALEDAVLRARIATLQQLARREPLGPAPLLVFALALRAQTVDLHRVIWGVALGAPPALVARELVTAA